MIENNFSYENRQEKIRISDMYCVLVRGIGEVLRLMRNIETYIYNI